MTAAAALSPERARDLGRSLAQRLVPLPRDAAGLAEAASRALRLLLPLWLPPGEEATAAALEQLARDQHFSTYLLAPVASGGDDSAEAALRRHLERSVNGPLQPLLLLFSQGCREGLSSMAAAAVPAASQQQQQYQKRQVPVAAAPMAGAAGAGSLLGLAAAAAACVAMGWLGYQLALGLGRSPADPGLQDVLAASPSGASGGAASAPQGAGRVSSQQAVSSGGTAANRTAPLASLQCLGGGQTEIAAPADPSNYGPRLAQDWQGRAVPNSPALIVLHETVVDEASALNLFRRRNSDDGQQASYHVLIGRDGRRLRLVADQQRAFGAGDSGFEGLAVQLKPGLKPSVNNIALHVSLVSPSDDADGEAQGHSGYTPEQYRSLASQIALWQARWGIPASRVVTHQEVDRSGSRRDPRSFDWAALGRDLRQQWLACGGSGQLADLRR
jgi:N-acetyl-anhydromuramyl-L-alanine amidase AmpD